MENSNWLVRFLVLSAILIISRYIFGGWNASTLKSMVWSCILSTVAGIGFVIWGLKAGGHGVSFWLSITPILVGAVCGISSSRWIEQVVMNGIELDEDALVDSVFDFGLKNTWNSFADEMGDIMYSVYSKGVAVYSNLCILTGMIIFLICK